ncbi:MAG: hypothetical protein Kow00102_05590 [Spirochaetota bacterium]
MNRITTLFLVLFIIACNNEHNARHLYSQALSYYIKKDFISAERLCTQSLDEAKTSEALFLLSRIYYFTKNEKFESTVKKFISHAPGAQGYILYARWCIDHHNTQLAKENLMKALSYAPDNPAACYLLGTLYYSDKNYDDAIITFHRALSNYFYCILIHKQLFSLYSDMGLHDRAIQHQKMIQALQNFEQSIENGE